MFSNILWFISGILACYLAVAITKSFTPLANQNYLPESDISLATTIAEVIEYIPYAALVLDINNNLVYENDASKTFNLIKENKIRDKKLELILDNFHNLRQTSFEKEYITLAISDTEAIKAQISITKLSRQYILVFLEDKTEFSRFKKLRNDFVANVGHELKTPIGAISLLAEALIEAKNEPDQISEFATIVHKEASRLGDLVQDIIVFSRLQSTDIALNSRVCNVSSIISESLSRSNFFAQQHNIFIRAQENSDLKVFGDFELLVRAANNLLDNAVKYSSDGARIGFGAIRKGGQVALIVSDQGEGMAEGEIGRIFERFYRIDKARSRNMGGTGLGLSIVKHIVRKHGGEIAVWSLPGVGSTFTIFLPIYNPDFNVTHIFDRE